MMAIVTTAGLLTPPSYAQEPPPNTMMWNCISVDDGKEWECSGNDDYQEPAIDEQVVKEPSVAAEDQESGFESRSVSDNTTSTPANTTASPSTAPSPNASTTETTAQTVTPSDYTPPEQPLTLDPDPAPDATSTLQTEYSSRSYPPSAYECRADGDGWDCNTNPRVANQRQQQNGKKPLLDYVAAYPDAYAKPPAQANAKQTHVSGAVTSRVLTSNNKTQRANNDGQWDCRTSDNVEGWDCQPLNPIAAPPSNNNLSAAMDSTGPQAVLYPYAYLDWYDFTGPVDQQTHCAGGYIQPGLDYTDAELPIDQQPTYLKADSTRTSSGNFTRLDGDVYLRQGNRVLRAQSGQLDHDRNYVEFQGNVLYRQPDTLMLSDKATFDQQYNEVQLENAQYVFHDSQTRGSATQITRLDNGDIFITNGSYTRCEPGNDSWTINSSEIALYEEEGYGVAKHATLRIAGVPVFYLPVFQFPIDDRRKSGFLIPSLAYSEDNGLDIAAPFYWNIAANYDATITPRSLEKRGMMLETEFRYLDQIGHYDFSLAMLPNDDQTNQDRWLVGIDHSGKPAKGWSSRIDYTAVSDNDYFDDLNTSALNVSHETHLDQTARMAYSGNNWQASAKLQGYQTITDAVKPYEKLPELRLTGNYPVDTPLFNSESLGFNYMTEYSRFDRDNDEFTGIDAIVGDRVHLETTLSDEYIWPWAYIRPKLRLTHTRYDLEDQPTGNASDPSRSLPLFSLDTGIYFDRNSEFEGKAYTHTLEPRLYYLYVPFEDQSELPEFDSAELTFSYSQLFRDNRFSGKDRIGDTHQVTLGLTNRFLEDNGAELFHASIGQIFYLKDRQVRLDTDAPLLTEGASDFVAEAVLRPNNNLRITTDGQWDQSGFSNVKRNLKFAYQSDLDHLFTFAYRFERDSLEQTDLSFIWPINGQWSVLGRWLQDLDNSESLDRVLGLEYENCCWRVRTLYRDWIDDDDDIDERENSGIFLQVTLKGLGTAGTRAAGDSGDNAGTFLEDITGFKERENNE